MSFTKLSQMKLLACTSRCANRPQQQDRTSSWSRIVMWGASLLRGHTDSIKQKMDLHTNEDISAAKHWIEYACPCCQFTFEMLADRRSTAQIIASLGLSGYVSEAAVVAEVTRLTENRLHNRPSSQLADQNPETADIVQKHVAGPIYQKHQQWSARHSLLPSQAASNTISSLQPGKE